MVDTVVSPNGTNVWDVSTNPGYQTIGQIRQNGRQFSIEPQAGTPLAGVAAGPYSSKEDAMDAIAKHMNGDCRIMNPG